MKVILIMTDTQRTDMLGCYGADGLKTPNIDSLADSGMRFDSAYTTQPVCGPARSAIFTGLYPHSNGMFANSLALGDNVKTVGQRLRDNGIKTAYIGKWHLDGGDYFGLGRCPDGWQQEYWYDMRCYLDELTQDERTLSRQPAAMDGDGIAAEFTFGHRCSDKAIDFIEQNRDQDYLLVVSYDEPHGPYLCPEPYASMYNDYVLPNSKNVADTLANKPEHQRIWAGAKTQEDRAKTEVNMPHFFGCNSFVDHEIGRVLKKIDDCANDALIIYTSDHGDMLESHCLRQKGPVSYDEICRIPFIIRGKDIAPKSVYKHPVSHIDIVPTIMEYAGLNVPAMLQGKSLAPLFKDSDSVINDHIFIEFGRYEVDHDGFGGFQPLRAVFDGRYKLTINLLTSDELYDLETDPEEMLNLIDDEALTATRNRLHDAMLDWQNNSRDPFRGYYWHKRPWRKDAPQATWDYTGYTRQRENEEYEPRQLDYDTGLAMDKATRIK